MSLGLIFNFLIIKFDLKLIIILKTIIDGRY
jgi:hypothetical protein